MSERRHWVYRPENRWKLWAIQGVVLLLVLAPEPLVHHHAHFAEAGIGVDASFGFHAWYGFAACAVMVVLAKVLGFALKRRDDYYDG